MIKLNLNREQLRALCGFTNPAEHEAMADFCIKIGCYESLDKLFNLVQVGEMVSKTYLFTFKNKYRVNLKNAEAASLLMHTYTVTSTLEPLSYEHNVALIIRAELHSQLTNFQRKFYGNTTRQNTLTAGDQGVAKALAGPAGSSN